MGWGGRGVYGCTAVSEIGFRASRDAYTFSAAYKRQRFKATWGCSAVLDSIRFDWI